MALTIPTRIYAQYRGKPKAVAWYNVTRSIGGEFADVYQDIRTSYNIDTASTDELNVIGRIVVLDRGFEGQIVFDPYRWGGGARFGGSGVRYMTTVGAGSLAVSDDLYRILLKAKIAKNNSDATIEGILNSISVITSVSDVRLYDYEDMSFAVEFVEPITSIARFALNTFNIIPKPQGVRFVGYIELGLNTYWGGNYAFGDERASFNTYFGEP